MNRPLNPVSSDPTLLDAITPNHFFLENRSSTVPSLLAEASFDHRKRFVGSQCYADSIWKTWLAKYVPNLNRRSKWSTPAKTELKSGDLEWVVDGFTPLGHFPMGRIENLRYGSDCIARSTVIRTNFGKYIQPGVKIMPVLESTLSGPEDVANAN